MIPLLVISLQAAIIQPRYQALLVTAAEQVEDAHWSRTPTAEEIAAMPPSRLSGEAAQP